MIDAKSLKQKANELGFDTLGICSPTRSASYAAYEDWIASDFHGSMEYLREHLPLKKDPEQLLPGVRSILVVRLNYNQPNPPRPGHPRIARYALGRDYHKVLKARLRQLEKYILESAPEAQCRSCVDSAPLLERSYAQQAGLGWFGKNTCLIDSRTGSWFFIGALLTTFELELDQPAVGGCGTCTKCIDACPTGAIVLKNERWQIDARRCISYLTIEHRGEIEPELETKIGEWTFGCDICQEVCPFNQERESQPVRGKHSEVQDFRTLRAWPTLEGLTRINHEEWDLLTRGSPVRRTGHEGLKRNARINLQNQKEDN